MNGKKLSSTNRKKDRTAVVVIHGIGEQRPVNTLRDFVKNVMAEGSEMWEKPDIMNGNFETRKITARLGSHSKVMFDFYEYYWAHNMRSTKFSNMIPWLKRIIFRVPTNISERLKIVYFAFWTIVGAAILFFILNLFFEWTTNLDCVFGVFGTFLIPVLSAVIMSFFFNYLGDAAVYLDPDPNNISERNKIREEGIKLVQGLHSSGEYKKIVLIGHSLGSVIAYDIVKFLWSQYYNTYTEKAIVDYIKTKDQNEADANMIVSASKVVEKEIGDDVKDIKATEYQKAQDYQKAQNEAFKYIKKFGNEWLITDLVTIGSPLAHAKHLFTNSESDLKELTDLRDFPVCPPLTADPFPSFVMNAKIKIPQGPAIQTGAHSDKRTEKDSLKVYYYSHSSQFAVTKWTNFYFSNDFVGGPLSKYFGKGILDVEIKNTGRGGLFPSGHTKYWDKNYKFQITENIRNVLNSVTM